MDKIAEVLSRGVEKIYPSRSAFEKVLRSGKKLRLYQGFDPTGTQLHIGHLVGLMKLRQFQLLGHKVIFLIGDGTGQAGDPSGKTKGREKFFTRDELRVNARDYVLQAKRVVQFEGKNPAEVLFNGDWLNKLTLIDILDLFGKFSVQQLIERDIFQRRLKEKRPINLREFIYPILQGYDSVAMNVDLEIGGSDQTFNMLTGRTLVGMMRKKEKFVLTLPLLSDSTGRKIGKTEGNIIALTSKPSELFGMIMNLPDDVILPCFTFITSTPLPTIERYKKALLTGENPMTYKKLLAKTLITMLHDEKRAIEAQKQFEALFQGKKQPTQIPSFPFPQKGELPLFEVLVSSGLVKSRSHAKTLIREGAVEIDGEKCIDILTPLNPKHTYHLRVGKHTFLKLQPK
ncbi:tyrosine--tRNA ligase [Candidatus Gottesmanbacteria bacterium]|nr:tyrosine--tRNA ligase [Candidatus Gottesmanbacteria bacterium]